MSHHPDPREALRSAWHLAVVEGPDTGWCLGLGPEPAEVGRGAPDLPLTDPLVSRRHLQVRERRGRVQARDHGSANGTRWRPAVRRPGRRTRRPSPILRMPRLLPSLQWLPVLRPGNLRRGAVRPGVLRPGVVRPGVVRPGVADGAPRFRRRLPARWHDLPPGARLSLGTTVLEVRRRPTELSPPAAPEPTRPHERRDWLRLALPLVACLTMVPLLLSSAAGPWRWAILAVPLVLVAATVAGSRPPAAPQLPDPAGLLLLAAARAARMAAGTPLRARVAATPGGEDLVLGDGDRVALVGAPHDTAAAARWLVCQLATWHGDLRVDLPQPWRWAGRLRRLGPADAPRRLTVHLAPSPLPAVAGAEGGAAPVVAADEPAAGSAPAAGTAHLVLATSLEDVPSWCTRVVSVPRGCVPEAWAAAVAALVAPKPEAHATLPSEVHLADLLGPAESPGFVAAEWAREHPGLAAPVGLARDGAVELDLVAHGPHALLAGTTGSGKSELLLAWLLGLAVRHAPTALQLVLVDYKGGATFAGLAGLPHTAGVLTDLEPAATRRALTSLHAEVRRRERLLADAGAKDLASYLADRPAVALPRLVVVVDEFRVLADAHPDVLDALVRLAAQGRSLGIHLVLATQRPGGSVSADVRANLTVRICLRVLEAAESQDVVGTAGAAHLPAVPGRALVRTDGLRTVQAPWCGEDGWPDRVVRAVADAWSARKEPIAEGPAPRGAVPGRPWAPPLPGRVALADLPATGTGLALGRTDLPEEQRLGVWAWEPSALLVAGGPGTGRTETLRTVVAAALQAGVVVHVVATEPLRFADLRGPTAGTLVGSDDPRRVARLLQLLERAEGAPPAPDGSDRRVSPLSTSAAPGASGAHLLVIDDAETVAEELDLAVGPGQGLQLLARALRSGRRSGVDTVLSGPPSLLAARWAELVRTRLVLSPRDETEALLAGVPRGLHLADSVAGRGVLLDPGRATAVQVALTGPVDLGPPASGVLRVAALPDAVQLGELLRVAAANAPRCAAPAGARAALQVAGPGAGECVVLGRGGDDAGPLRVGCGPGDVLLVVGPPGSGRTSALATLRAQLAVRASAPSAAADVPAGRAVLVIDDVDRWSPAALDDLDHLLASRRDLTVLASARPEPVAGAYRGALATWRVTADLLLLRASHPTTAQLTDVDLATAADRARPRHPGRGVLVARGTATAVQVATPDIASAHHITALGARVPEA
ncbi:FHA domain-containing protein [Georgenia sp. EYE_87]|uniref:FtsK/SpoIIIE domain-containing protein n=1 Tax=Georgenia sp. EYE_87 TaxID=2853448 RepID=UPI0027E27898|nr:FtsK/SpoIIIE domain-containing protein [Georgenia sp. EYE_87]MCK6212398.1 FHA domain-containing protein [Georgenia sp. EYE_87]